ncbi:major facilitator superfamily domain-containing protein 4A-like [Panonychus citri]|uniref:major facilitator superfamily domain-containing protein 4A-like n=1 Tax=Panonychus citri TaxID=50023 RepID=UPI002307D960|nr:major facilitator superfamily domain-containing protein 4A-like [Panonychus citri]
MSISDFIYVNRYKIIKTFIIYVSYLWIGGAITLIGSSLLDLQIRVDVDFGTISYLIPARSLGHIVGSALAGLLDRYFSHSFILLVNSLISGISIGIAPNFNDFKLVAIFIFIAGVAHGILDVTCNTFLASTWKEKCANWLQVLHMCFGVGSLIAPVICRPFLLPMVNSEERIVNSLNLTSNDSLVDPLVKTIYNSDDVMIQNAFFIIASLTIVLALPFGWMNLSERKAETVTNDQSKTSDPVEVKQPYSSENIIKSCFSFYRLIYIPLTFVISETKLLLSSLTISFIGILITVPWANYYTSCIWAGFTLIGIGISPIFSAAYGMLAKHIIVTSKISSMVFIPGVLGESIHPAIAATLLDKRPIICLYYIGVSGILFIVLYLILLIYCAKVFKVSTSLQHEQVAERSSIPSINYH